jgi:hypothetical protein
VIGADRQTIWNQREILLIKVTNWSQICDSHKIVWQVVGRCTWTKCFDRDPKHWFLSDDIATSEVDDVNRQCYLLIKLIIPKRIELINLFCDSPGNIHSIPWFWNRHKIDIRFEESIDTSHCQKPPIPTINSMAEGESIMLRIDVIHIHAMIPKQIQFTPKPTRCLHWHYFILRSEESLSFQLALAE